MGFPDSHDSGNSEASQDSFFDTLQSWALNFAQLVFEPVMNEPQQRQSSGDPEIAMPKFSASAHCIEEVFKLHTRDAALSVKHAPKQSLEEKLRDDVAFITLNVSHFAIRLCISLSTFAGEGYHLAHSRGLFFCARIGHDFAAVT